MLTVGVLRAAGAGRARCDEALRETLDLRHRAGRRRHPGGAAGHRHHRARHRRAAHGGPPRHHPQAARGGDAGLDHRHLLGQDRHPDPQRDDRASRCGRRRAAPARSRASATRPVGGFRRGGRTRSAGRPSGCARLLLDAARCATTPRCSEAGRALEHHRRPHRGGAGGGGGEGRAAGRGAARRGHARRDAIPFESEHQFMATLHEGPDGGRRVHRQGRAGGGPAPLRRPARGGVDAGGRARRGRAHGLAAGCGCWPWRRSPGTRPGDAARASTTWPAGCASSAWSG